MADGVGTSRVVRVGQIESGSFERLLNFREIGLGADFAEADDIRVVLQHDAQGGGFFRIGLRLVGDFAAFDDAIHGQPVFHIVGHEAQLTAGRLGTWSGGCGRFIGIGLGEPVFCCGRLA